MNNFTYEKKDIVYIPINKIIPNPYQPRKIIKQSSLNDLANSIKLYGVIQPICVRYVKGIYEVISGERRLIASKKVGLKEMPCIVSKICNKDCASITLIENIQRESFNFFEEAEGFQSLMVNFGYSKLDIAKTIGKSQYYVEQKLKLLKLHSSIKSLILENNVSEKHAFSLLKISDIDLQNDILNKIIKYELSTSKTNILIEKTLANLNGNNTKNGQKVRGFISDLKIFTNSIKSAVDTMKEAGVSTNYSVKEMDNGYEINIKVCR